MKNTLTDLNNYLFEQLEKIADADLKGEELEKEIKRGEAVTKIAKTIIENGALALSAKKYFDDYGNGNDIELSMFRKTNKLTVKEK